MNDISVPPSDKMICETAFQSNGSLLFFSYELDDPAEVFKSFWDCGAYN